MQHNHDCNLQVQNDQMRKPETNLMEENVATKVEKVCKSTRENYLQGDNTTGGAAGGSIEKFSKMKLHYFT